MRHAGFLIASEEGFSHKVSPQSTDPVTLNSVYSKLKKINKVVLDSPEALCLHSAASCTHCTNEQDLQTREIPYGLSLPPRLVLSLVKKNKPFYAVFGPFEASFLCSVVIVVTLKKSNIAQTIFFWLPPTTNKYLLSSQFCYLRRLVFDKKCPVQPISESRVGPLSVTQESQQQRKSRTTLLLSNKGYISQNNYIFNTPGVAKAVLQTALLLIN